MLEMSIDFFVSFWFGISGWEIVKYYWMNLVWQAQNVNWEYWRWGMLAEFYLRIVGQGCNTLMVCGSKTSCSNENVVIHLFRIFLVKKMQEKCRYTFQFKINCAGNGIINNTIVNVPSCLRPLGLWGFLFSYVIHVNWKM